MVGRWIIKVTGQLLKLIEMYLDCGHSFMDLYIFQNALYTLHRCSYVHKLYLNKTVIKKEVQIVASQHLKVSWVVRESLLLEYFIPFHCCCLFGLHKNFGDFQVPPLVCTRPNDYTTRYLESVTLRALVRKALISVLSLFTALGSLWLFQKCWDGDFFLCLKNA